MPRRSRIDAVGALHHIMVRGIERGEVFGSDTDRDHFVDRLGHVLEETETICYAWVLIPNHFHLLHSGHSVLMGKVEKSWQDTKGILGMFSEKTGAAKRAYSEFVEKGIKQGRRQDLTGGGLIRSAGGWEAVKALKKEKVYQRNDERILGDGEFVSRVLSSAEEAMEKRYALRARGFDLEKVASRVSEELGAETEDVWARGRYRHVVEARSLL